MVRCPCGRTSWLSSSGDDLMPGLYTDVHVDRTSSDPYLSQASPQPGSKEIMLALTPFVMWATPATSYYQAALFHTKIVLTPIVAFLRESVDWDGPSAPSLDIPVYSPSQLGALTSDLPQHAPHKEFPLRWLIMNGLAMAGYVYTMRYMQRENERRRVKKRSGFQRSGRRFYT